MMYVNPFNEALHLVLVAMKMVILCHGRKSQISPIFRHFRATGAKLVQKGAKVSFW